MLFLCACVRTCAWAHACVVCVCICHSSKLPNCLPAWTRAIYHGTQKAKWRKNLHVEVGESIVLTSFATAWNVRQRQWAGHSRVRSSDGPHSEASRESTLGSWKCSVILLQGVPVGWQTLLAGHPEEAWTYTRRGIGTTETREPTLKIKHSMV